MSNKKSYFQLILMVILTLLTQVVTLMKMSVVASNFGASIAMDAFNFTNNISTFLFSFISTGVTTVLIPAYVCKRKPEAIDTFISTIYTVSIITVVVLFSFREPIAILFSSGNKDFVLISNSIMIISLISQLTNTIIGVANAYFQAKNIFNLPKVIVFFTTLLLTGLVLLNHNMNIYEYSYYILITSVISMTLHLICIGRKGFHFKLSYNFKDIDFQHMIRIFLPTIFSAGLYQITLLTDSLVSSSLGSGQISILNYSNSIIGMINMLLTTNLLTFIYPRISKNIEEGEDASNVFNYFPLFFFIMMLVGIGIIDVGKTGISFLYERGSFSSNLTSTIYICTVIYTISLPINMVRELVYRSLYAHGETKLTFRNSICASIVNLTLSIVLSLYIGIYGVILGTVITSIYSFISIMIKYCKKYEIKSFSKFIISELVKITVAAILTVLIVSIMKCFIIITNELLFLLFYGVMTVVIYMIILIFAKTRFYKIQI